MCIHKIYIILLLAICCVTVAGAQEPEPADAQVSPMQMPDAPTPPLSVAARIAGLETNAEYMSLLHEDARLLQREDSIANAVSLARQRLREDAANRRQHAQEILRLENGIFALRTARGRLIDRINSIEQEWVLSHFSGGANSFGSAPAGSVGYSGTAEPSKAVWAVADSLKVRNLVFNPCFAAYLPAQDHAALLHAQTMEPQAADLANTCMANHGVLVELAEAYSAAQAENEALLIYGQFTALQAANRSMADSLSGVWSYIFDNKSYAYDYLLDRFALDAPMRDQEQRQTEAARQIASFRGATASDAVVDYFLRKRVLVAYETAVAEALGLEAACDSLCVVAAQVGAIDYILPRVELEERYFLDLDSLTFSAKPRYDARNPIPETRVHPRGTIYRILLGTFDTKRSVSTFRGTSPLGYLVEEDGRWSYFAGGFASKAEADSAQQQAKARGFFRPEIVVWVDGVYRNLTRDPITQQPRYRIEIMTTEALPDVVREAITATAGTRELSRVGQQMFVLGAFDERAEVDRVAEAIRQVDAQLEIKVTQIAE